MIHKDKPNMLGNQAAWERISRIWQIQKDREMISFLIKRIRTTQAELNKLKD